MNNPKSVQKEIDGDNPWYVEEQLKSITAPHQKRTIRARWNFIGGVIEKKRSEAGSRALKALDAGCGDGINLSFLTKIPGVEITAFDYNPLRVERARSEFLQIKVFRQDLTRVETDERDFDVILCSQVLEHIEDDAGALRGLKKLLAPSGALILGVPNEGCFLARLRNKVLEPEIEKTTDHVHFYTEGEIRSKLAEAGFSITDIFRQNFFFPTQKMGNYFASRDWGFNFMGFLNRIFPSQAAGYYFSLVHGGNSVE